MIETEKAMSGLVLDVTHPSSPVSICAYSSLLCRLVDLFREKFPDEFVARNLIISADNTPRESKNQWFGSILAALVGKGMWDSVELQFLQTSHSHNELDQRFSSIAALLERASVPEDAEEVKCYLEKMLLDVFS